MRSYIIAGLSILAEQIVNQYGQLTRVELVDKMRSASKYFPQDYEDAVNLAIHNNSLIEKNGTIQMKKPGV